MPSKEELQAYDLEVKSLERPFFSVVPRCKYRPNGKVTEGKVTACSNHLEPFKVEGCFLQCNSTSLGVEQGYIVCLDSSWHVFCLPTSSSYPLALRPET